MVTGGPIIADNNGLQTAIRMTSVSLREELFHVWKKKTKKEKKKKQDLFRHVTRPLSSEDETVPLNEGFKNQE